MGVTHGRKRCGGAQGLPLPGPTGAFDAHEHRGHGACVCPLVHIRVTGPHDRANVVLADRPLVFGRDPHCDVVLEDPGVSHRHLVVQRTPYGVEASDLGSANGVTLDGAPFRRGLVTPGHVLRIGATTITFDLRDEVVSHVAPTLVGARLGPPPAVAPPAQPAYVAPGARGPSPSAPAYVPPGPPGHAPRRRKGSVVGVLLVFVLVLGGLALAGFVVWTRYVAGGVAQVPSGAPSGASSVVAPVGSGAAVGIEPLVFDRNPFEAE